MTGTVIVSAWMHISDCSILGRTSLTLIRESLPRTAVARLHETMICMILHMIFAVNLAEPF